MKIICFLISQGFPSDLYFIDKIIDLAKKNKESKFEIYVFEKPSIEFLQWRDLFLKIMHIFDLEEDIKVYDGLNLFFEKTTQRFCLMRKVDQLKRDVRFSNILFPLLIEGYKRIHGDSTKDMIIFCGADDMENSIHHKDSIKITVLEDSFKESKWSKLIEKNKDLNLNHLGPKIEEIHELWKSLENQPLNLESKDEIKSFLETFSNSVRQDIFYIVAENEGITARKIQNKLKMKSNFISLPAILKHLSGLIKINIISKKDKFYFPKFKRLRIVMAS